MILLKIDTTNPSTICDWSVLLIKAILTALPVIGVTVTIFRFQRNREKLNIVAQLSALYYRYIIIVNEIEKCELKFQLAKTAFLTTQGEEKANNREYLKDSREKKDRLFIQRLDTHSQMTELFDKFITYITLKQWKELWQLVEETGKFPIRNFDDRFKDIKTSAAAIELEKTIISELDAELINNANQELNN